MLTKLKVLAVLVLTLAFSIPVTSTPAFCGATVADYYATICRVA